MSDSSKDLLRAVCEMRGLWQNGRKICPDFYTIHKIT